MSIELKIKSKHLSEEAKIIKFEERKLKRHANYQRMNQESDTETISKLASISNHRRCIVRNEQRSTFLARAFLAGKKYLEVENICKDKNKRDQIIFGPTLRMVNDYGIIPVRYFELFDWFHRE